TATPEETPNPDGQSSGGNPKVRAAPRPKSKPKRATTKATALKKPQGSRPRVRRPFPQNTLEDALRVPQVIKEKKQGKQLEPELVAKECNNLSHKGDVFFYLAGSSRDYGLTSGSRDTATISLTELGKSIVYPESAEEQRADKIKASFNVKLFKDVFE